MRRVWAWQVLACQCGATRRVVAVIPAGPVANKILRHLGLPTAAPALGHARLSAQTELWDTGPPLDDLRQAQAYDDFDQRLAEHEFPE